jgi:apolipoprotein N-acyltransferase
VRVAALDGERGRRPPHLGRRIAGAVACGVGLALAFPPYDVWPLLVLAVAGMSLLVRGTALPAAAGLTMVAGLAFFLVLLRWATVIGSDAWVLLALLEASAWLLLGAGLAAVQRLRFWPAWAAAVWVLVEALRATVPLGGFPWGRLAFGVTGSPLLPWAAIGGAAGLSALVAFLAQLLALAVLGLRRPGAARWTTPLAAVAGAAALVAGAALVPLPTAGRPVTVAAVQGNVPRVGMDFLGEREAVLRNHVQATSRLAAQVRSGRLPAPDLVVWPENSSDIDPFRNPDAGRRIDAAVADIGVPVLVGTLVYPPGEAGADGVEAVTTVENTGVVWDPDRGPGQRYVKRHPVPFGEYVPFRALLQGVVARLDRIPVDFASGDRPGVLELGGTVVGDLICFEVAYDDLLRDVVDGGAELLVVQTNNATYALTGQPEQQFAISRLRAVEHGRTLVVAATSGISGVVAPDGSVLARTEQFVQELVVERVPTRTALTPATRMGRWPELVLAAGGVLAVVAGLRRRRRRAASAATPGDPRLPEPSLVRAPSAAPPEGGAR